MTDTMIAAPITDADLVNEADRNYDLGRKRGKAEMLDEIKRLKSEVERIIKDRDELSASIEACHDLLDRIDPEYVEGTTSLVPLEDRLREELFPEGRITDDMVNGDD